MPELWDLLVHYSILKSVAKNLTTLDFFSVASTNKDYRRVLITDRDEKSLRNIKGQTLCDGEGCRERHRHQDFIVVFHDAETPDSTNDFNFPLLGCADRFKFCSHCGCKTCENCRVTRGDVLREHNSYPRDLRDMRPFGVWRCSGCHSMDISHTCQCTPERRWLLPYTCRRCFDEDISRTARTRKREHLARDGRIGLALEDPFFLFVTWSISESVANPWNPEATVADCDRCGREFIMACMHYMCPFCDGLHDDVAAYWNLQEYHPHGLR